MKKYLLFIVSLFVTLVYSQTSQKFYFDSKYNTVDKTVDKTNSSNYLKINFGSKTLVLKENEKSRVFKVTYINTRGVDGVYIIELQSTNTTNPLLMKIIIGENSEIKCLKIVEDNVTTFYNCFEYFDTKDGVTNYYKIKDDANFKKLIL